MRALVVLVVTVVAAAALPTVPDSSDLALMLSEEDYLDYSWMEEEDLELVNINLAEEERSGLPGCVFRVRGDLGQPQPVYIHRNSFMMPTGNSSEIRMNAGEQIRIACPGQAIRHPNIINQNTVYATATCVNGATISGASWLRTNGPFLGLTCSNHLTSTAQTTQNERCFGNRPVIRVGFTVDNVFHTWYRSCFDTARMEVLYVWYTQTAQNAVHQTGVARPPWKAGSFFPNTNINNLYQETYQRTRIAQIVGPNSYITANQFLSRGHLTAKSDHPFATAQRATFHFINIAPQWLTINNGNWETLEQDLRARIGTEDYNTVIYTGTFGVTQLRAGNVLRDIYLHSNGRQVPVPLYFYKVVYDAGRQRGTAFVTINNPYYSPAEALALQRQICQNEQCRNNNAFHWLSWLPNDITLGYSFCCTIPDFRRIVQHIPNSWNVTDLLA